MPKDQQPVSASATTSTPGPEKTISASTSLVDMALDMMDSTTANQWKNTFKRPVARTTIEVPIADTTGTEDKLFANTYTPQPTTLFGALLSLRGMFDVQYNRPYKLLCEIPYTIIYINICPVI